MRGDVGGVAERSTNLLNRQLILGGRGFDGFTGGDEPDDGSDIDSSAGNAGLAEAHVRVHGDARIDVHKALNGL